jgi:exonuclease III
MSEDTPPLETLRIATWNINGIRSYITDHLDSKKFRGKTAIAPDSNLAELLQKTGANVLCFQETRANAETMATFVIPGWRMWSNSSSGKGARGGNRYSGTSIWVHESFLTCVGEPLAVLRSIPTMKITEPLSTSAYIRDFFVVTPTTPTTPVDPEGRFPNSGSNALYRTTIWDAAVESYLLHLAETRPETKVVWCADWNVAPTPRDVYIGDPARTPMGQEIIERHTALGNRMEVWRQEWEQTDVMCGIGDMVPVGFLKVERDAWQRFLDAGYVDSWRHMHQDEDYTGYTWYSLRADGTREARLGWRIDQILVSKAHVENIIQSRCLPEVGEATKYNPSVKKYGSDHVPLFTEIRLH